MAAQIDTATARTRKLFLDGDLANQDACFAPVPDSFAATPVAMHFLTTFAAAPAVVGLPTASKVGAGSDQALQADVTRTRLGVTGAGVRVGILSDSYNVRGGAAAGMGRGDLPDVTVLREGPTGGADEGRAMAELVHKIAPNASISFYSAFNGAADFANGILALARGGAKVIVDDVTYLNEPFFQAGGAISRAVSQVVAAGVDYFTSASNQGTNFFQSAFNGIRVALPGISGTYAAQNFGTAAAPSTTQGLTIARGATATLDLQWDEPFASIGVGKASANSLGMVLYDANNKIVASAMRNGVGGDPVQILQFTNNTASSSFRLAIVTNGGPTPPGLFKYIAYGSGTTINDPRAGIGSGAIIGHEMVDSANVVGAAYYAGTTRFGGTNKVESFSSVGPGTTLFDEQGNRLATPKTGTGVDFVAPDGSATSVFQPFYGTSAAAPNAAAVAALLRQINPLLSPDQMSSILARSTIAATGPAGATGTGLVQADRAATLARYTPGALSNNSLKQLSAASPAATPATAVRAEWADTQDLVTQALADPGARADFTASLDLASGIVEAGATQSYNGAMTLAMTHGSDAMPQWINEQTFA